MADQDQRPVLLVVDEEYLAGRLADDLRARFGGDYRIETATTGERALDLLALLSARGGELAIGLAASAVGEGSIAVKASHEYLESIADEAVAAGSAR